MDEGRKVIVEQEGSFKQREARPREGAFESFQVEQRGRGCSWNSRHLEALEGRSQLGVGRGSPWGIRVWSLALEPPLLGFGPGSVT